MNCCRSQVGMQRRRLFSGATALGLCLALFGAGPVAAQSDSPAGASLKVLAPGTAPDATDARATAEPEATASIESQRTASRLPQSPAEEPKATDLKPLEAPQPDATGSPEAVLRGLPLPEELPLAVDEVAKAEKPAQSPSEAAAEATLRQLPLPDELPLAVPEAAKEKAVASAPAAVPPGQPDDAAMHAALDAFSEHSSLPRKTRDEMAAFYGSREMKPLWLQDGAWTATARQAMQRLAKADEDGLKAAAYAPPASLGDTPGDKAAAEVAMSEAIVRYARDASGARVSPGRVSQQIDVALTIPEAGAILGIVASGPDADAALRDFNPPQAGYRALRGKLAELRRAEPQLKPVVIPPGQLLKIGMSDPRVPLLRERLSLPAEASTVYDATLAAAIEKFQKEQGLAANGRLNRATTAALSGSGREEATEAQVIASMEAWRWLPRDLGERYVIVNIPEFMLRVVDNGTVLHSARVIVGKPDTQTPIFTGSMEYLVVNPYWNVPPSILKKEFLPKLAADPDYAAKNGYEVVRRGNTISIRQPPGERNALGHIKFMFPNRHAVYIHDTPSRKLFVNEKRAYSHGCVRVQEPFDLARIVLENDPNWNADKVRALIGRGERTVRMQHKLPVYLTYFTAFVDDSGRLQTQPDIYGHGKRIEAALGLL